MNLNEHDHEHDDDDIEERHGKADMDVNCEVGIKDEVEKSGEVDAKNPYPLKGEGRQQR